MDEVDYYKLGEDIGYLFTQALCVLVVIAGVVALVVAISRHNKRQAARGHITQVVNFGLQPGEAAGPQWPAVHITGAPMTATITTANVLALAYNAPGAVATRIPKEGAVVALGPIQAPPPGWPEPLVEVTITSPVYAPFTVRIVESGARQLSSWASA